MSEQVAAYDAALKLLEFVEEHLEADTRHFRDKDGKLLLTLDEVARAIESGNFDENTLKNEHAVLSQSNESEPACTI